MFWSRPTKQKNGRNVVLVFNEGMQQALKDHIERRDYSKEAKLLAKASRIIRQDILNFVPPSFTGILFRKYRRSQYH